MRCLLSRHASVSMLLITTISCSPLCAEEGKATADAKPVKTKPVKLNGGKLTLNLPTTWKKAPNATRMRLATFQIPATGDEKDPGELTIFNMSGNTVKPNVERWIGQFESTGREVKVTQGKLKDAKYYFVEISGTFNKSVGPPILRKTKPHPNYRMLGAIMPNPDGSMYFLKLSGPKKMIAGETKNFRKAFGGKKANEEKYEF